ncbi:phosphotransferase [Streptomyces sp. NPDC014986]|uniref:phosphotransferase n=1 Tax=Streptomyces sp. NPDC014986 TaxID=3364934 RepID=UPI0037001C99
MTPDPLLTALTAHALRMAHTRTAACPCGATRTLAHRPDATVVRHADTVAKAHAPDTDPAHLALRLTAAARRPDVFVPPLRPAPIALHGRLVTFWPYGTPVDPDDPDAAPWEPAAALLALLHRTPVDTAGLPAMRGPARAAHAVTRLRALGDPPPAAVPVLRAWAALPAWARAEAPMPETGTLCHGDLHLGQLVRLSGGRWRLIDVDDLGVGDPVWDLARPAAWYACGLLPAPEWERFLDAYRAAGGPAVPAGADPWAVLDVPARALTVQTAARMITKAVTEGRQPDEPEQSVIDACARMVTAPPWEGRGPGT